MADVFDEITAASSKEGDVFDEIHPERPESLGGKLKENFVSGLKETGKLAGRMAVSGLATAGGGALGSLAGPVGTALGATGGALAGEKLNQMLGLSEGNPSDYLLSLLFTLGPEAAGLTRGAVSAAKPVFEAKDLAARNILANRVSQGALRTAEGNVAQAEAQIPRMAEKMRPGMTTTEAFAPIDRPVAPLPDIELPSTVAESKTFLKKMIETQISTAERSAGGRIALKPENEFQAALLKMQSEPISAKGALNIVKVPQYLTEFGKLTNSSDPKVFGPARHVYKQLISDLEASTLPEAKIILQAQQVARQNIAADELADAVTAMGSYTDKFGRLVYRPEKIRDFWRKNPELRAKFPEEHQQEFENVLEDVFRARAQLAEATQRAQVLPEVIEPKYRPGKWALRGEYLKKHAMWTATAGASGSLAAGHPEGIAAAIGVAGTQAGIGQIMTSYPRLIFRLAMNPRYHTFLRSLYQTEGPKLGDTARAVAMAQFLHATGEDY